MSTWLNFNLFDISHRKKRNHMWILDPQIIYDGAFCDNIISGSYFTLTKQLQLPLYATIFSSPEKISSMGEEKNPEESSIPHIGTYFCSRCEGK